MIGFWRRRETRHLTDPIAFQERLLAAWGTDPRRYSAEALRRDFNAVFRDARARRVLYKILEWGHVYQPAHVAGDSHATAFRDGERNMALRILAAINAEVETEPQERAEIARPEMETI
ncbi:MAG: Bbp19 family protein [Alphaproteobacteria bacterium]